MRKMRTSTNHRKLATSMMRQRMWTGTTSTKILTMSVKRARNRMRTMHTSRPRLRVVRRCRPRPLPWWKRALMRILIIRPHPLLVGPLVGCRFRHRLVQWYMPFRSQSLKTLRTKR